MTDNNQKDTEETQEEVYSIVEELRNATGQLPGFAWAVVGAVLLLGVILVVQSNNVLGLTGGEQSEGRTPVSVISPADSAEVNEEAAPDPNAPVSVISPADSAEADESAAPDPNAPVSVISPAEDATEEADDADEDAADEGEVTPEPVETEAPAPTVTPAPTEEAAEETEDVEDAEETAGVDMEAEIEALQARVNDLEEEIIAYQAEATTRALQMDSLRATVTAATSDD